MQIEHQQQYSHSHSSHTISAASTALAPHPICALSASEISYAAQLIRSQWPSNTDLRFKTITLEEPLKTELLPYFIAEAAGKQLPNIERRAFSAYYIRNTVCIAISFS